MGSGDGVGDGEGVGVAVGTAVGLGVGALVISGDALAAGSTALASGVGEGVVST